MEKITEQESFRGRKRRQEKDLDSLIGSPSFQVIKHG